MKIFKKLILLTILGAFLTGCSFRKDNLEGATIHTTVYPIQYLAKFLYKDYGVVDSIYPDGADISSYELTTKQIKKYAKGNLFIYNGQSNEKNIAKNLINENRNLIIIDASKGPKYNNDVKELWLDPKNYLMMARNVKNELTENLTSKIIKEHVNKKFDEINEIISLKIAELESISKKANDKGTNTLIVSDNSLKFLEEKYKFNVISLDEASLSEGTLNSINNSFKSGKYKYVLVLDNNYSENINNLTKNYKANTLDVKSMTTIAENDEEDYLTVMQEFIDNIRLICNVD